MAKRVKASQRDPGPEEILVLMILDEYDEAGMHVDDIQEEMGPPGELRSPSGPALEWLIEVGYVQRGEDELGGEITDNWAISELGERVLATRLEHAIREVDERVEKLYHKGELAHPRLNHTSDTRQREAQLRQYRYLRSRIAGEQRRDDEPEAKPAEPPRSRGKEGDGRRVTKKKASKRPAKKQRRKPQKKAQRRSPSPSPRGDDDEAVIVQEGGTVKKTRTSRAVE